MTSTNGAIGKITGGASMFLTPGTRTYNLFGMSINGIAKQSDAAKNYIIFMSPDSMKIDQARAYFYWNGVWYYKYTAGGHQGNKPAADQVIPGGTGFMCSFETTGATLTYSGEVLSSTENVAVQKPDGATYFFSANPYPVAINTSEVSVTGIPKQSDAAKNYIIFMTPSTMKIDQARAYFWWNGAWYYKYTAGGHTANKVASTFTTLEPGEAFMCVFATDGVALSYPGKTF